MPRSSLRPRSCSPVLNFSVSELPGTGPASLVLPIGADPSSSSLWVWRDFDDVLSPDAARFERRVCRCDVRELVDGIHDRAYLAVFGQLHEFGEQLALWVATEETDSFGTVHSGRQQVTDAADEV
ncbi:putative secreted protein [Saccharothrix espanaensis DSM 44229]|uniref:Putative secreted protein n=1 Tax=Saccharothrix espanaensis (strain ATCC 51144 / DSM 44229 / JCM 9112 / NBRC 15066 / NRRL 15764) TaxID=1179773 RepID=K0JRF9_SACES|nr:putative secreted protein [Saccharothrix espanaensis DSM 44229]